MSRSRGGATLWGLLSLLSVGCPDDPPEEPPLSEPTLTLENLCTELARADCERLEACGLLSPPLDVGRCMLRQDLIRCAPLRASLSRAVDSGELVFFELAARSCRDRIRSLPCDAGFDADYLRESECRAMISGRSGEGGVCSLPYACAEEHYCEGSSACPGICRRLRGNNEACSLSERCAPDFFCVTPGMRCRSRVALDAPCELSIGGNSCRDGAFCDRSQPGTSKCVPVRGRGSGCRSPDECAPSLRCIGGLCSGGLERDTCQDDRDCQGLLLCSGGRCTLPRGPGEMCGTGTPCGEALVCTSSVGGSRCTPRSIAGEACSREAPCYLDRCVMGMCTSPIADGEACVSSADCYPGRTCSESRCAAIEPSCVE